MMNDINIEFGKEASFLWELAVTLELESDGNKRKIFSSNIEHFELELHSYGFEGLVHFSGFDNEEIEKIFNSEKPIKVVLTYQVEEAFLDKVEPAKIQGVVYERVSRGIEKEKKTVRAYQIRFCDGAKATWSSHFIKAIHINKTMKDVIDSEKNPLITLEYDWPSLIEEHPIIAFSLEDNYQIPPNERSSFYSFLHWYLQQEGGIFEYNFKDNKYKIMGKKSEEGELLPVAEYWITSPRCTHPTPSRTVNKDIRHFADRIESETDENDKGYASVRKDWFKEEAVIRSPEQGGKKIKSPSNPEKIFGVFWVKEFAEKFQFDKLFPGTLVSFKGNKKTGGQWCDHEIFKGKTFRIQRVLIKGEKRESSQGLNIDVLPFSVSTEVQVEDKEEIYVSRPTYVPPQFPFSILGTVFCDEGEEDQTTFKVTKGEKSPLGEYHVKVPLCEEEDKYVVVPFSPYYMTGQFYFPFCKNQEVLLRMYFNTAKVQCIENFQPLVELPEGIQGCQIVWASNGANQYTLQKHEFEEGKNPVFTIKQSSSENQLQVITIKEKEILINIMEKNKQTLLVQLSQESGILIKMEDKNANITHTSHYGNTSLTHTTKGDAGTSIVEQKPDSLFLNADNVTIKCEDFLVDAARIGTMKAASKVVMDTPLTKTKELSAGG